MKVFSGKNELFNKQLDFMNEIEIVENNSHNKNSNKEVFCSDCQNYELIDEDTSQGNYICKLCGVVLGYMLDYSPEWKQYEDGDVNARCSGYINPLLPISSMGTFISGSCSNRIKLINNWNSMQYKERSLNNEFKKIHNICQKYSILKCIEDDAKIMFKMISECRHENGKNKGKFVITRGKNRISISAACLYVSCSKKEIAYTPKEIADMYNITHSEMNKGIKNLRKLITNNSSTKNSVSHPSQFIKRYCNKLQILNCYNSEALTVATNVEALNIATEHNPFSIAAACIMLVVEKNKIKKITRKKLADEFEISDITIIKTFKKIEIYKKILFDKKLTDLYIKNFSEVETEEQIPDEVLIKMKEFGVTC